MPLLSDKDRAYLKEEFGKRLHKPVRLVLFTQDFACEFCSQSEQIVQEVADLSDLVEAEILDFVEEGDRAKEYGIDKIPALAVVGEKDYGIRFFGVPSGYEFTTLIEGIFDASGGESDLSEETRRMIDTLTDSVHIQVFVTPT